MLIKKHFLWLTILLLSTSYVFSLDSSITVGIGADHTDNGAKTSTNERSDLESYAKVGLRVGHVGKSVEAKVDYNLTHREFDRDTQDNESTADGNILLTYQQIEKVLNWTLSHSRRNVVQDKALNDLQSNREDRSITSLSPNYTLRLSSVDSIITSVSYTDIRYEDSDDQDSDRMGANLGWTHRLSKVDTISLNGSYQDVNFDNDRNDYEYTQVFITYQAQLARLFYVISLGYNESDRDSGDASGGYFKLDGQYKHSGSILGVQLLRELSDTSRDNNNESFGAFENFSSLNNQVDIFERSNVEVSYTNDILCSVCSLNVSFMYENEDYETLANDNVELGAKLNLSYKLSRLSVISFNVQGSDFSFDGGNIRSDYKLKEYGVNFRRELSRALSFSVFVVNKEKDSDADTQDYDELRGGIGFRYTFD